MIDALTEISTALAIEDLCRSQFGYDVKIKQIIADALETSKSSRTTVFETTEGDIFAYCHTDEALTYGDVIRIVRNMGMEAKAYIPPASQLNYFSMYGKQAFQASFPGRHITERDNLTYYESLAPYSPALVHIAAINGEIRGYIPAIDTWYTAVTYTHKQIEVQ